MQCAGAVLIADPGRAFCESTAARLRDEGHHCDVATSIEDAVEYLRCRRYDVLIAESQMPGGSDLDLARESFRIAPDMPIVLVSECPTAQSAIEALELPVVAYLAKPVDFDLLAGRVREALEYSPTRRTLLRVAEELTRCVEALELARARGIPRSRRGDASGGGQFLPIIHALVSCVHSLSALPGALPSPGRQQNLCRVLDCPQWSAHQSAFRDTIQVLQEVKRRFKSKELGDLRAKLEEHLRISE
jgi:CheY-like chemotaxis protein